MRLALVSLLAPLLLVGPALLPGRRLLPQLPVGFEPLASERPAEAREAWVRANLVTSDRLFPILTDELAIRSELAQGRLPLWEPDFGLGTPLFAGTVVGPCYPPNWLRYALPPDLAGGWLAFLSLWLAGLGMGRFLARLGLASAAAGLGAIAYQMSGFAAVNLHYAMKVDAALWLPWALWAILGLETGARRAGLALALSIACALLAGFPQIGAFTAGAALFFAAWRALERRAGPARLARALTFIVLGVGIAAVQLVPMAEASAHALRRPHAAAALWPERLPLESLLSIPCPRWFFGAGADTQRVNELTAGREHVAPGFVNPLEWTIGGGALASALALVGMLLAAKRARAPLCLFLLALGFAQGWPLVRLLYYLPGANLGAPGRAAAVAWAALAWLAGLGIERALAAGSRVRAIAWVLGALLLAEGWFNGSLHLVPRRVGSEGLFPASEALEAVRQAAGDGRVLRLDESASGIDDVLALARPNLLHAYGIADLTPYIVFTNARLAELFEAFDPRTRYRSGVSRLADPAQLGHPLLDLLRVTCVLSRRELAHERLELRYSRPGFFVYRRSGALPVARGVTQAVTTASDATAVGLLASGSVPLASTTVLAPCADLAAPLAGHAASAGDEVRVLSIARPAPGRLDAEVEASAPGYVVFSEAWMPGWKATVDGAEAPLVRADHVARAVPVPEGKSTVRTRYAPVSLRLGALASALALLAAALVDRRASV